MKKQKQIGILIVRRRHQPVSLTEWVNKNCPGQKDLIKEALSINDKYQRYMWHECCAICDTELSDYEMLCKSSFDYIPVCQKHRRYRSHFRIEVARRLAGIKYNPPHTDLK